MNWKLVENLNFLFFLFVSSCDCYSPGDWWSQVFTQCWLQTKCLDCWSNVSSYPNCNWEGQSMLQGYILEHLPQMLYASNLLNTMQVFSKLLSKVISAAAKKAAQATFSRILYNSFTMTTMITKRFFLLFFFKVIPETEKKGSHWGVSTYNLKMWTGRSWVSNPSVSWERELCDGLSAPSLSPQAFSLTTRWCCVD